MYQNNSHQLCANRCNEINMWTPCQKSDPTTKCLRSHYKNLANLTELCWRYLKITISFFMQIGVARSIRGPCQKSNARINSSRSQLKILANLSEICWRCLIMTISYCVDRYASTYIWAPHQKQYIKTSWRGFDLAVRNRFKDLDWNYWFGLLWKKASSLS